MSYNHSDSISTHPNEHTSLLTHTSIQSNHTKKTTTKNYCLILITIIGLIGVVTALFVLISSHSYSKLHTNTIKSGLYVQLKSYDNYYIRTDKLSNGLLVATENIPWLSGSTFVIHLRGSDCWALRSVSTGKWVVAVEQELSTFSASGEDYDSATCFDVFRLPHTENGLGLRIHPAKHSDDRNRWLALAPLVGRDGYVLVSISDKSLKGSFTAEVVDEIRGVNLGGLFIPEVWMTPSFFRDTGLGWGGSLCTMVKLNASLAEERMKETFENWITADSITEIAEMGFNSIRVPVGYWNLIEDPYERYAPRDYRVSLQYIDWLFDSAAENGLSVLLDLHGAPGSQNGIDHSGCAMSPEWTNERNVNLTLDAIKAMAIRYGSRSNLLGFELLNEPSESIERTDHDLLLKFYSESYGIIRQYSDTALVVFNELYEEFYSAWKDSLVEPDYYNVVVDWHLYNWQEPYTSETADEHIRDAENWASLIDSYSADHPIIIGEWTMSTGTVVQAGQPFVDACLKSFAHSFGWYAWNWKVERTTGFDEWDVQYQNQLPGGISIV